MWLDQFEVMSIIILLLFVRQVARASLEENGVSQFTFPQFPGKIICILKYTLMTQWVSENKNGLNENQCEYSWAIQGKSESLKRIDPRSMCSFISLLSDPPEISRD